MVTREVAVSGRWWVPAGAAAAVVLVATGIVVVSRAGGDDPGPAAAAARPAAADPLAALLVRDGDRVVVSGEVRAVPGRPVRFCAAQAVGLPGYPPGQEPPLPYCDFGVTLVGVDLSRLSQPRTVHDVRTGGARIEGRYAAGTITVQRQAAPDLVHPTPSGPPQRPPCPAPAGGWSGESPRTEAQKGTLAAYVRAHPDRFAEPWVAWPNEPPPTSDPGGDVRLPAQVMVVGTTGDVAAARQELARVSSGNLCVTRVKHPAAEIAAVYARAADPGGPSGPGVYGYSQDLQSVSVTLVVVDPAALAWLRRLDAGRGIVTAVPDVRPLRP
jgi:hypothetical protein